MTCQAAPPHNLKKLARRQLFVHPRLQGALIARTCLYSAVSCTLGVLVATWTMAPDSNVETFLLVWVVSVILAVVPLVFDMARVSNRIVGPLVRTQNALSRIADGHWVMPLRIRANDPWQEWLGEFNRAVPRLNQAAAPGLAEPPARSTMPRAEVEESRP